MPLVSRRLSLSLFALSLALTSVGLALLLVMLPTPLPAGSFGFRGSSALFALSFSTVGWLVSGRQPANALGWLFAAVGALSAGQLFAQGYAVFGLLAHPGSIPGPIWAAWLDSWLWAPAVIIVAIHLLLLFPDGHLLAPGWRFVMWLGVVVGGVFSTTVALAPGPLADFSSINNPAALSFIPAVDSPLQAAVFGLFGLLVIASASSLVVRFRRSGGIERQQLRWIAYAGAVLALTILPSSLSASASGPLAKLAQVALILATAGIAVAAGIAILRYRLYDLDLLVNRTVVYGSVTGVLALAFVAANIALQYIVESLSGQRSELITGALGVGVGLAFGPLRRGVRPIVDRFLPSRGVLILLFTDIVGSTQALVELGDERWRSLLGRYLAAVRAELARYGGHEVNTAGDAFFATFDRPMAGLQCAWGIRASVKLLGLGIRTGLHLGAVEMRGEQVSGLAVHAAARVMAAAGDGEILVSAAVRDALTDPAVALDDRGSHELKGVPGAWQLYAVQAV